VPFLTFQEETEETPMIRGKRKESIFIPDIEELNVEESVILRSHQTIAK